MPEGEIFSASVSHLLVTVQAERRVKTGRLLQEDFLIEIARSTGEILLLASHAYGPCLSTFSVDYSTCTSLQEKSRCARCRRVETYYVL
jgi:hypothetical protein